MTYRVTDAAGTVRWTGTSKREARTIALTIRGSTIQRYRAGAWMAVL